MTGGVVRAGRAFVELFADDSRLVRGLRTASAKLRSWGARTSMLGVKLQAAGGAIMAPFMKAIHEASTLEEVMNKFGVVFGENAETVKAWGDEFAAQVGRSKRQIADFMAGSQDLFLPLGFDPQAATAMSKQVTQLAVDLASFNNMADADSLRDLHAALTGSGEVMKKYGVIVSEAAVKQELLGKGIDPKRASDQEKVMARLAIIMRGTTAAQGDAIRSAGSFANQWKAVKAKLTDLAAVVGSAVLPMVTKFVKEIAKTISWVTDWASQNAELILTVFKIAVTVTAAGAALLAIGGVIMGVGAVFGALTTIAATVGTVLGAIGAVLGFLISPIGLITVAVVGLAAAFLRFTEEGQQVLAWLSKEFDALKATAQAAWTGIRDALAAGDFKLAAKILWLTLKMEFRKGVAWLTELWVEFKESILATITELQYGIARKLVGAWAGLRSAWVETVSAMSKAWSRFTSSLVTGWKTAQNWISKKFVSLMALLDDSVDAQATQEILDNDFQREQEQRDRETQAELSRIEQERQAKRHAIDEEEQSALGILEEERNARHVARRQQ